MNLLHLVIVLEAKKLKDQVRQARSHDVSAPLGATPKGTTVVMAAARVRMGPLPAHQPKTQGTKARS